jgi:tRNA A-37 threonylcarbamoyl transferase component Bud32
MKEIIINKNCVRKKYYNHDTTVKEYKSMKYIQETYNSLNYEGHTYRSLRVNQIRTNGYTMEYINGTTLSKAIFDNKKYELIVHAAIWLANYTNQFRNHEIAYLSDYTTHNVMISKNKEVIVIDQTLAKEKKASPELIISYLIARFDFEKTLHLNFSKKYLILSLNSYNQVAKRPLRIEVLKAGLSESYKRLYRKIKNRKFSILKILIFKIVLNISLKFVVFKINTLSRD